MWLACDWLHCMHVLIENGKSENQGASEGGIEHQSEWVE